LPVPAAAGPDQEALAALAGTRILLVEDNELNQEVAVALLSDFRVKVDVAENGAVAIEKLAQEDYDLVLMDMQMPVMDGIAATEAIRRQPQFATLPIVAMTANAMQQDRDRCIDAGMNDHIAKPIDPDDLIAKLHKWTLNQGRTVASAAIAPASAAARPIAEIFAGIAGLDVALGLRQVLGREALYLSLLDKFVRGQADAHARIAAALLRGDGVGAEIIAHTLKGVAAQIGANQVSELAAQVERAIHQGQPTAELAHLGQRLAALVAAIEPLLPQQTEVVAAPAVDDEKLREICGELERLLSAQDFASAKLFEDNAALLRAALGDDYGKLAAALEAYDYPAAHAVLTAALPGMGQ
jgi:two-component system sensor histidine kinase/response regulator